MTLDNLHPNDVFFQKILHRGMGDDTIHDVILVEKKAAVKEGENYLSYLTRFTLKYVCNVTRGLSHEKVHNMAHLILKEEPRNSSEKVLQLIRDGKIFSNERRMLEQVVPEIEKLIGKRLGPKVYYSSDEPHSIIIMEDLMALGFHNQNRKVGLNKNQVFMVLENLADFHAASVSLNEQNPGFVSCFSKGFFHDKTPEALFTFIEKGIASIGDGMRNCKDGTFHAISDKLGKKSREIAQRLLTIYQCDVDELRVLNHGDVWVNNIMFREDEHKEPQEVRFVDYQMCIWTSPAIDLLYFLSIAPETSIKMTHDEMFLQKYLTRLSCTMKKLGCSAKSLTLEQLKKSMYKRRDYALMAGIAFYPKMIAENDEVEPIDAILETGEAAVDLLQNPKARETMEKILPILNERGYLD